MNKKEFIKIIDKKLSGLDKVERIDIINEYMLTIEENIMSGKSEEEAIIGFGDIDVFVEEMLDTYKSNKFYFASSVKNKTLYNLGKIKDALSFKNIKKSREDICNIESDEEVREISKLETSSPNIFRKIGILIKRILNKTALLIKKIVDVSVKVAKWIFEKLLKIIRRLSKLCVVTGITLAGLLFGFSLILTFAGFPTIGLLIAFFGTLIALGLLLNKSKLLYFLASVVVVGSGIGISTMEAFSLELENYTDYLSFNYEENINTYSFNPNHEIFIHHNYLPNVDIIVDENIPEGEIQVTSLVESDYCFVDLYIDVLEEDITNINILKITTSSYNIYGRDYFQTAFWKLKEDKIVIFDRPDTIKKIEFRVNPNTNIKFNY
ncbi:MAG: hypothetical protein R3Y29_04865 [bacterium]